MIAIWGLINSPIGKIAGVILIIIGIFYAGYNRGQADIKAKQAKAIAAAIENRSNIDENVTSMDAFNLCIELGGLREQCEQLRGVEEAQP